MNPFYETIEQAHKHHQYECVSFDEEKYGLFLKSLINQKLEIPNWRNDAYWPFDDRNFIQFLVITSSINAYYCDANSKKRFTMEWRGLSRTSSFGMISAFMRAYEEGFNLLDAKTLAGLTDEQMKRVFRGDPPLPLLLGRKTILNAVGKAALRLYDGEFANLFEAANYRCFQNGRGICERLVREIPEAFSDTRALDGQTILFNKKALLVPLLYVGRAHDSEYLTPLKDWDSLSPVIDYRLPQTLCELGIIRCSENFQKHIALQKEVPAGSLGEIEMRLLTGVAAARLMYDIGVLMTELDYLLWASGKNCRTPHMLVPTLDY
ncbi:MAG: queuosine salvage family protein [Candidatus Falkowbacteria bacterium]